MTQLERYKHNGYTIVIDTDDDLTSPREFDNSTVMVCWHPRYNLGDSDGEAAEIKAAVDTHQERYGWQHNKATTIARWLRIFYGARCVQPLYLLDHSGLSISTSRSLADPGGWDTSMVGFVFDTDTTRYNMGLIDGHEQEAVEEEVKAYSNYLEGGYVGYTVLNARGDVVESCWGIDDIEYAKREAEASVPTEPDPTITDAEALDALASMIRAGHIAHKDTETIVKRTGRTTS